MVVSESGYSEQRGKTEAHVQLSSAPWFSRRLAWIATQLQCTDRARQTLSRCIVYCHNQGHCFPAASVFIAQLYRTIIKASDVPVGFDVSAETQRLHQNLTGLSKGVHRGKPSAKNVV